MNKIPALLILLGLGLSSCERHEWHTDPEKKPEATDTINLFLHEDHSGDHDKSGHHGGEADPAKDGKGDSAEPEH